MRYGLLTFPRPERDTGRKILHVDMDAFYASVEMRDQPALRHQPVVIAKHPNLTGGRGIVSTCNYKAREYGIHSAMSAAEAYKRCPHAVFIQGNMQHYAEVSKQIHQVFQQYTDLIEPLSLDEAYLDVTDNKVGEKSASRLAKRIQQHIYQEIGLTCSVGVSYNKFLAKVASDYQKPSGITVVPPEQAEKFLDALPIQKFYGIGKKSVPHFLELGIKNGYDLRQWELDDLMATFGKMGQSLYLKVRGIHHAPVQAQRERKSIGKETTFVQFLQTEEMVTEALAQLCRRVYRTAEAKKRQGKTVTLKIRYEDFETLTRQHQYSLPLATYEALYEAVVTLWEAHGDLAKSIRLLGVSISNFKEDKEYEQLAFGDTL